MEKSFYCNAFTYIYLKKDCLIKRPLTQMTSRISLLTSTSHLIITYQPTIQLFSPISVNLNIIVIN